MTGTEGSIHILFVDDEPDLGNAAARFLELEDDRFVVETAKDANEGEARLEEQDFDCVVSDYDMPGRNGVEFLEAVRDRNPNIPFILYTGKGSEEVASEAISAGVTDYLQKEVGTGQYTVLANRIGNAVAARRSSRRHEETKERLAAQNRALRRLYEVSADREMEFDEKIQELLELGREYLGTASGLLASVDIEEDRWRVEEVRGTDDHLSEGMEVPLSETYCQKPVVNGGVLDIVERPDATDLEEAAVERWKYRTYIGTAVRVAGTPYGVLCFADREARSTPFDEADRTFVELASRWISSELERRRNQREIQRHSEYTDDLLDALDDVFYVLDTGGYLQRWNESLASVTGYSDREMMEMQGLDFFPDEYLEPVAEAIAKVFEEGSAQIQAPLQTRDGEWLPYEFLAVRVSDPEGRTKLVGVGRDIAERRKQARALEREREQLDALVQNLPNPVVRGSLEETDAFILDVNPAFEEKFGYDLETVEGRPLHDFVLPEEELDQDPAGLVEHLKQEGELHTEVRRQAVEGPRDFRLDVTVRTESQPPEGFAIYTDITEQKERERRRERRFEAIFNHSYQLTGLLEPDGTLVEVNDAALEVAGLDEEDVLGERFWETPWWDVDDETIQRARRAVERAAAGEFVRFETKHQAVEGKIYVDFSIRPVTDEDGNVIYLLPEGRNITELKALQEREQALERQNERLDEFASLLSHDLRNPLNTAVTHLELARHECDCEDLDAVGRAHERMEALIDDVLALARDGKKVTETDRVDLAELFECVAYDMDTRDATLQVETDRIIRADERRLRRILENLVRNAVEHGGDGVVVRLGDLGDGFFIEDDGRGIPEDEREKVFETGYSTSRHGTGFGLSIARQIAEAHDWAIRATESDEGGARFEITGVDIIGGNSD
jgi:PAS domain S-box-containing protein